MYGQKGLKIKGNHDLWLGAPKINRCNVPVLDAELGADFKCRLWVPTPAPNYGTQLRHLTPASETGN